MHSLGFRPCVLYFFLSFCGALQLSSTARADPFQAWVMKYVATGRENAAALYSFADNMFYSTGNIARNSVSQSPFGDIAFGPSVQFLPLTPGIRFGGYGSGDRAVALVNASAFSSALITGQGISIEIWFEPARLDQSDLLVGLGSWTNDSATTACGPNELFAIYQDTSSIRYEEHLSSCAVDSFSLLMASPMLRQVVITIDGASKVGSIYINGVVYEQNSPFNTTFSAWVGNYSLFLGQTIDATNPSSYITWQGLLYLLAIYPTSLNETTIASLFQQNLPRAPPALLPKDPIINVVAGASVSHIVLNATDLSGEPFQLFISTLPSFGKILMSFLNSEYLVINAVPAFFQANMSTFAYIPDNNFCGQDLFTFTVNNSVSPSGTTSVVRFNVLCTKVPGSYVVADGVLTPLNLSSLESLRTVVTSQILALPESGTLYFANSSDQATNLTKITQVLLPFDLTIPIQLFYQSGSPTSAHNGHSVIFTDVVTYRVQSMNTLSQSNIISSVYNGSINISVIPAVQLSPLTASINRQGKAIFNLTTSAVNLQGQAIDPQRFVLATQPQSGILSVDGKNSIQLDESLYGASYFYTASLANTSNLPGDSFQFAYVESTGFVTPGQTMALSWVFYEHSVFLTVNATTFDSTGNLQSSYNAVPNPQLIRYSAADPDVASRGSDGLSYLITFMCSDADGYIQLTAQAITVLQPILSTQVISTGYMQPASYLVTSSTNLQVALASIALISRSTSNAKQFLMLNVTKILPASTTSQPVSSVIQVDYIVQYLDPAPSASASSSLSGSTLFWIIIAVAAAVVIIPLFVLHRVRKWRKQKGSRKNEVAARQRRKRRQMKQSVEQRSPLERKQIEMGIHVKAPANTKALAKVQHAATEYVEETGEDTLIRADVRTGGGAPATGTPASFALNQGGVVTVAALNSNRSKDESVPVREGRRDEQDEDEEGEFSFNDLQID